MKTGRKTKPYRTTWGETIDGLYKCPDGRWRITATGERFTEHDERSAVMKFRRFEAKRQNPENLVPLRVSEETPELGNSVVMLSDSRGVVALTEEGPIDLLRNVPEFVLVNWMRDQLYNRPKWCADVCGIEQLGYLTDIKRPEAAPATSVFEEAFSETAQ